MQVLVHRAGREDYEPATRRIARLFVDVDAKVAISQQKAPPFLIDRPVLFAHRLGQHGVFATVYLSTRLDDLTVFARIPHSIRV